MDLGVDREKEPQFARSRKKPLEFLRESVKTLRKVGKQYEKPGLLFICYSCTLDKLSHLQDKTAFVKVE